MKATTKAQNKALSMRDALNEFKSLKVVEQHDDGKDWRTGIWNYPTFIEKFFKKTIPFSYIFVFASLAVLFVFFLQSNSFSRFLKSNSSPNDRYTEGMVGAISLFNPLFASANTVDKSIQSLVFEKFIYIGEDGKPKPGLARDWTTSADSLTYTFTIDENSYWSDGTNLTIDDVLNTFDTATALVKANVPDSVGVALEGVNITKIDSKTLEFTLSEANPTFFEAVAIYIVPKAKVEKMTLKDMPLNNNPIMGSGKYSIVKTEQNAVYLLDNEYDEYEPKLKNIVLRVYPDYPSLEMAMRVGDVDALGSRDNEELSFMSEYPSYGVLMKNETYRDRILFLNVRKENLKDKNVRIGLTYLLDINALLQEAHVLGKVMQGPYPDTSWAFNNQISYYAYNPEEAVVLLNTAGYSKNIETGYYESKDGKILSFTLSYLDNDINNRLVDAMVALYDKEGVVIKPDKQDYNEISQQTIVTRNFEMLLYEVETTVDPDQYNLWHSSKVNAPAQNLSGYVYERVDILLEDARKTTNQATRKTKYLLFQKYLMADEPVIFLYHPTYVLYFNSKLRGIDIDNINFSNERYWNIEDWYWEE